MIICSFDIFPYYASILLLYLSIISLHWVTNKVIYSNYISPIIRELSALTMNTLTLLMFSWILALKWVLKLLLSSILSQISFNFDISKGKEASLSNSPNSKWFTTKSYIISEHVSRESHIIVICSPAPLIEAFISKEF